MLRTERLEDRPGAVRERERPGEDLDDGPAAGHPDRLDRRAVAACSRSLVAGPSPAAEALADPAAPTTFKWVSMPSFLCESSPTGQ